MAKTKEAGNNFEPGREYLARIIAAQWSSLPTVGPSHVNLVVQVKLAVLCHLRERTVPEFVGREAVIFLPVAKQGVTYRATTEISDRFSREIGLRIVVEKSNNHLEHNDQDIVCKFGREDPIHGFQSIEWWRLATPDESSSLVSKAMKTSSRRVHTFGLTFPSPLIASRDGHTMKFGKARVSYFILKRLAQRYPVHYPSSDLAAAWTDCDRPIPDDFKISVSTAVSKLRSLIKPSGLTVCRDTGFGYLLAEIKLD
jgi:hypothetical protein